MSTVGSLRFGLNEYGIPMQAYPGEIMPWLRELVKEARAFARRHNFTFVEAMEHLLDEATKGMYSALTRHAYHGDSDYFYKITNGGEVYWKYDRKDEWKTKIEE
jgi:hypothetical protein